MGLKLITPPTEDPVTLAQAKSHLVVEHSDHDTLIELMISAATSFVDGPKGFLGRALLDQTWDYYLDEFPSNCSGDLPILLPLPPTIEVVGVFYIDTSGTEQQLVEDTDYYVDLAGDPARVTLPASGSWPTTDDRANAVRVRFRAGYLDTDSPPAADVPAAIKLAILLHVGDLYRNRETTVVGESVSPLPWAAEQLLRPFRFYLSLA